MAREGALTDAVRPAVHFAAPTEGSRGVNTGAWRREPSTQETGPLGKPGLTTASWRPTRPAAIMSCYVMLLITHQEDVIDAARDTREDDGLRGARGRGGVLHGGVGHARVSRAASARPRVRSRVRWARGCRLAASSRASGFSTHTATPPRMVILTQRLTTLPERMLNMSVLST